MEILGCADAVIEILQDKQTFLRCKGSKTPEVVAEQTRFGKIQHSLVGHQKILMEMLIQAVEVAFVFDFIQLGEQDIHIFGGLAAHRSFSNSCQLNVGGNEFKPQICLDTKNSSVIFQILDVIEIPNIILFVMVGDFHGADIRFFGEQER